MEQAKVGRRVGRMIGRMMRHLQPDEPLPHLLADASEDDAVVDCALYVRGVRQPGGQTFHEAYAAARRRRNGSSGWACSSRRGRSSRPSPRRSAWTT